MVAAEVLESGFIRPASLGFGFAGPLSSHTRSSLSRPRGTFLVHCGRRRSPASPGSKHILAPPPQLLIPFLDASRSYGAVALVDFLHRHSSFRQAGRKEA